MRQFFFGALLLGAVSVVRAVNDFQPIFTTYIKGDEEEIKWINFSDTDLKSLSLVGVSTKNRIPLTLEKCAESGKTQNTCTRWVNTGKFEYEGDVASVLLTTGSSYYFELTYVDRATGTKVGTSKSTNFIVQDAAKSSSGSSSSSSSKSKSKSKKKGKLSTGAIAGIAVAVAALLIIVIIYVVWKRFCGKKGKKESSKELGEVEMGKQADPLMGQDGRIANTTVWSADTPGNPKPQETGFSPYEPYKATTTGQGATAEYYNDQPIKTTGNVAAPVVHGH